MNRLKGKVAVITGGALGLGRATALRMAHEGAAVAVTDVLTKHAGDLADELINEGFQACCWPLDVSKEAEVEQVLKQVAQRFGRIDILVNNAGVAGANKPTDQITEAEWDFVQAINVKGVFFGTKHVIPHLRRSGGGSIINLSSIYGLVSAPDLPPYHASKGAVRLMLCSMRRTAFA
jgi:NAD(P)-dependent dehydrogenase (short-subunit alcohol dehydrogenase family)